MCIWGGGEVCAPEGRCLLSPRALDPLKLQGCQEPSNLVLGIDSGPLENIL